MGLQETARSPEPEPTGRGFTHAAVDPYDPAMTVIKALGATITYDEQTVTIKHSMGFGTVTVPISHVLGVDLQDPSLFKIGHLEITTRGASHKGKMPDHPLRVTFGKRQLTEIHTLYDLLIHRTGGGVEWAAVDTE